MELVPRCQSLVPQVPGEDLAGQAVVRQVPPGQLRRPGGELNARPGKPGLPLGYQQQQGAHPQPRSHTRQLGFTVQKPARRTLSRPSLKNSSDWVSR